IAENGALMVEGEKQLHLQPMKKERALDLIKKVRRIGGKHLIVSGIKTAFIEGTTPEFLEQVKKHYEKYKVVEDLTKIDLDAFLKITICDLSGAEENSFPHVKNLKDEFQVKLSGEIWIDFTHKLAQKGNALKKIQDLKGISAEDTMAFGDYLNDIEMFEHAKYGFAMQNAHEDVKKAASYRAKSNDAHGVELVLKDLLRDL
ncbi:MAG TPA: HAD family hydrolase, partial [Salinimicrobium sp.]|nr:HAD family hydrolase [Salinimicrobium sp.]